MDFFTGGSVRRRRRHRPGDWAKVRLHRASAWRSSSAFAAYTRSLGRPFMFFMILIMIPLATTEIGTDGWITGIMEGVAKDKFHPGWILVYTSAIMMVLRFFAGPIVHASRRSGLLAVSAVLAIVGLYAARPARRLAMIFVAATLYGFGKTFFWPTMLGVVSDQTPTRRGADAQRDRRHRHARGRRARLPVHRHPPGRQEDRRDRRHPRRPSGARAWSSTARLSTAVLDDKRIYEIIPYKTVNDAKLTRDDRDAAADAEGGDRRRRRRQRAEGAGEHGDLPGDHAASATSS